MRMYEISPAMLAAMRRRALAAPRREAGIPLHLEAPTYEKSAPGHARYDAEDARAVAGGFTLDPDEDDDFY